MPYLPELIAISIVGIALILFIAIKIINNNPAYKTGKQALLNRYQQLRHKSNQLQNIMSSYIMQNHNQNEIFMEGYSYADFLKHLQKNHFKNLSDKKFTRVKTSNNRILLNNAKTMLDEQEQKLNAIEAKLKAGISETDGFRPLPSGQD